MSVISGTLNALHCWLAELLVPGPLEVAQQMAGHESDRTTGLYDRRNDSVVLNEEERVVY